MTQSFHVAIIMDGNGRWAQERGKQRLAGHRQGFTAVRRIVESCPTNGVRYLTLYAFSVENWFRPEEEVSGIMRLLEHYLKKEAQALHKDGVCVRVIGQRERLPSFLRPLIEEVEALTAHNTRLGLQLAISYGGRHEIVEAARSLAQRVSFGQLRPEDITDTVFQEALSTYPWPDPDLLIRTGGEIRLSNYLLWQLSYTELYFCPQYWPEFTVKDFKEALAHFHRRDRRFGRIPHAAAV